MKSLINILTYQAIWFMGVLGGTIGAYGGILLLLIHLIFSPVRGADLRMMGFLLFTGLLVDGTLHQVGFISFTVTGFPIPFWLMVIWLGLAITPHHSLAWLKHRLLLSMFFGAMGGPVAYWAGTRLGAATFNYALLPSLLSLSLIWAILWPVVMYFSVVPRKKPLTIKPLVK
ncbi:DUF2878 domain-containing protein [Desulfogranum marinum]|uniref:DUF2878 domain-containing protein n=1 Tax=Desulfogranum marinum TaxID=453220 RepID=UPI0029C760AB|nr:DUF2878 domain-containing protein [Desulfogranum marinum]